MTIDETIDKIEQPGRRAFLKGMAGLFGAVAVFGPKSLFSQEKEYDLSWGSFYVSKHAIRRYSDVRCAFKELNVHIIQMQDETGATFYRILTFAGHDRETAIKTAKIKHMEIEKYFKSKHVDDQTLAERLGEVGIIPKRVYDPKQDITPIPEQESQVIVKEKPAPQYYLQVLSTPDSGEARAAAEVIAKALNTNKVEILAEIVNGKTYYKPVVGPYKISEKNIAHSVADVMLREPKLSDFLDSHQIVLAKIKYEETGPVTDWAESEIIKGVVMATKKKLKEYGQKAVSTSQGKKKIDDLIDRVVAEYNKARGTTIDPDWIRAKSWVESKYNTDLVGYKLEHIGKGVFKRYKDKSGNYEITAYGLLQVTKEAAAEMGFDWEKVKTDPYTNLQAGVAYFGKLYAEFKDFNTALGAYNCGPTRVRKNKEAWKKYKESTLHVERVNKELALIKNRTPSAQ